jgi:hypothetical protein
MAGQYHIALVPERSLVRLTMGGFYEEHEVRLLAAAFADAVSELASAPNQHVTICDIRQMAIQSQETVRAFTRMMGSNEVRSRRLAFVTARSLSRMQARRLTDRPGVAFFDDLAAAEAWLEIAPPNDASHGSARPHRAA